MTRESPGVRVPVLFGQSDSLFVEVTDAKRMRLCGIYPLGINSVVRPAKAGSRFIIAAFLNVGG